MAAISNCALNPSIDSSSAPADRFSNGLNGDSIHPHPNYGQAVFIAGPCKDLMVQDPLITLLQASLMPDCTTILVMDGSNFSMSIFETFHALNATLSVAFMETEPSKQSNLLVSELTTVVQHTLKIKRTSPCLTIVLASDDIDFIINFIRISFDNGLLVHTTRLLLLTRRTSDSLHLVQEQLSIINAAVVSLKELEIYQRYVVYVYLPYSRIRRQVASWTSRYGLTYFNKETLFPNKNKRLTEGGHLTIAAIYYPTHSVMKVSTAQDGSSTVTITGPIMEEADMALGPLAITYERAKVVQYTAHMFDDYIQILASRGNTEVDPWGFVLPFNKEVWASLLASLALSVIVSFVCAKITIGYTLPKGSLFAYYRILVQQVIATDVDDISANLPDADDKRLPWWERMIFGGWLLTVFISVESYSGNLMSQLAVRYISQPYQSLRVVMDDPRIKIMWMSNTVYEQYLKIIFLSATGSCRFYLSREKYLPFTFAMVVQKNSPLLQSINDGLHGIVEGGLYNYWFEKAVPLAKGCKNPPTKFTVKSSLTVLELGVV
ncbi:uncharacterized protein [Macrobrachium rosenbergii]|uniref:uncharacterized protein n=1 Tax=Macrobrachium rosenbergii TaxID=79674 RepID=UPI0034D5C13D